MKLLLKTKDIETLKEDENGFKFSINTKKGKLTVEGIETQQQAVEKCEQHCEEILRSILKG